MRTERKALEHKESLILPWDTVRALSCRESNDQWDRAVGECVEQLLAHESLISKLWSNALKRLNIKRPHQHPLEDYLGSLFEHFHKVPLFLEAELWNEVPDEEKNQYIMRCLAGAMLTVIRLNVLAETRQLLRSKRAGIIKAEELMTEGDDRDPEKPPLILYVVSELLRARTMTRADYTGFAFFYPRLEKYPEFQNLVRESLTQIWPQNEGWGRQRIIDAHDRSKERWERTRNYQSSIDKQN